MTALLASASALQAQDGGESIAELRGQIAAKRAQIGDSEKAIAAHMAAQKQSLTELESLAARLERALPGYAGPAVATAAPVPDPGPTPDSLSGQEPAGDCVASARRILAWEEMASLRIDDRTLPPKEPAPDPGCRTSAQGGGKQPSTNRPYRVEDFPSQPDADRLAAATCALKDAVDRQVAVRVNPHMIQKCDNDQLAEQLLLTSSQRSRTPDPFSRPARSTDESSFVDAASVVAGRPLQPSGLSPKVEVSKGANASLGVSVPFYGRTEAKELCLSDKGCGPGYRSNVTLPSIELTAPLSGGEGLLFRRTFKDDAEEDEDLSDFQSGLGLKLGIDFLRFRGVHYASVEESLRSFLNDTAIPECRAYFAEQAERGPLKPPNAADVCSPERIVDWLLELKQDNTTAAGHVHARKAELVTQLHNAMWRAGEKDIPRLGLGGSVKFSFDDYKYRIAQSSVLGLNKDGDTIVMPVPGSGFVDAKARDHSRDAFEVELHGLIYQNIEHPSRRRTRLFAVPGLLYVPQVTWKREYAFAEGTEAEACVIDPATPADECGKVRYEAPRKRENTELSLEVRGSFVNVPYLDKIGFAPKFSYNLDQSAHVFDMPVYVVSDNKFASGIRIRHSDGFDDLLGNSIDPKLEVSLFFAALNFKGF